VATQLARLEWKGEDVSLGEVERRLTELRSGGGANGEPLQRTSVMTHVAWLPRGWVEKGRKTLAGLGERHPSRTILLLPEPDASDDRIDAAVRVDCFGLDAPGVQVSSEVIELRLRGSRAKAPASIVLPLLIFDLPVFLRWRGLPPYGTAELGQLSGVADRLIVDSTEWRDLPTSYEGLADLFERVVVSDIAWARTSRWRAHLATFWPGIASVSRIRVRATAAQAHLLRGWLVSRLGNSIELEHEDAERLEAVELDGEPVGLPPGDAPNPSDLLSDELETYSRDRVYEEAVRAAALQPK
jgi:glucose-6-phosphate dehydrogenase-like protein OpcA